MNLCSDGHEEVCYEGRRCPACDVAADKDRVIEKLETENGSNLDAIHELEQELKEAKEIHE